MMNIRLATIVLAASVCSVCISIVVAQQHVFSDLKYPEGWQQRYALAAGYVHRLYGVVVVFSIVFILDYVRLINIIASLPDCIAVSIFLFCFVFCVFCCAAPTPTRCGCPTSTPQATGTKSAGNRLHCVLMVCGDRLRFVVLRSSLGLVRCAADDRNHTLQTLQIRIAMLNCS